MLKFRTKTNSNMPNSSKFICFKLEISVLCKFGQKYQNCQFKLKLGTETNLNMKNTMVIFIFYIIF